MSETKVISNLAVTVKGTISRGIKSAEINEEGHLIFVLTDNTRQDMGKVTGEPGVGIESIRVEPRQGVPAFWVIITLTDGRTTVFSLAHGEKGDPGKSAYEIAVEHGYTGTEAEYTEMVTSIPEYVEIVEAIKDDVDASKQTVLNMRNETATIAVNAQNSASAAQIAERGAKGHEAKASGYAANAESQVNAAIAIKDETAEIRASAQAEADRANASAMSAASYASQANSAAQRAENAGIDIAEDAWIAYTSAESAKADAASASDSATAASVSASEANASAETAKTEADRSKSEADRAQGYIGRVEQVEVDVGNLKQDFSNQIGNIKFSVTGENLLRIEVVA